MKRIGLIGLGLLGSALAQRLLSAPYKVMGYDLDRGRQADLETAGGRFLDSPMEVALCCDVLVLSLPDSGVVKRVLSEIAAHRPAFNLILDTSTGDPEDAERLARDWAVRGVDYVDATILGSSEQVRQGTALVMVGGRAPACAMARPILERFGRQVFDVGPPGSGSRTKLVVNLVLGLNRAVLAEGLTLAKQLHLDPAATLEILKSGAAYSTVMETKGAKMLTEDFTPQARLSQHLKDVRLILTAAQRSQTELPLSAIHRQLLEAAESRGYGDADNSAIIKAYGAAGRGNLSAYDV